MFVYIVRLCVPLSRQLRSWNKLLWNWIISFTSCAMDCARIMFSSSHTNADTPYARLTHRALSLRLSLSHALCFSASAWSVSARNQLEPFPTQCLPSLSLRRCAWKWIAASVSSSRVCFCYFKSRAEFRHTKPYFRCLAPLADASEAKIGNEQAPGSQPIYPFNHERAMLSNGKIAFYAVNMNALGHKTCQINSISHVSLSIITHAHTHTPAHTCTHMIN